MPVPPTDWDVQDWILVAHALSRARWEDDLDEDRTLELARGIAAYQGLTLPDLLNQDATASVGGCRR